MNNKYGKYVGFVLVIFFMMGQGECKPDNQEETKLQKTIQIDELEKIFEAPANATLKEFSNKIYDFVIGKYNLKDFYLIKVNKHNKHNLYKMGNYCNPHPVVNAVFSNGFQAYCQNKNKLYLFKGDTATFHSIRTPVNITHTTFIKDITNTERLYGIANNRLVWDVNSSLQQGLLFANNLAFNAAITAVAPFTNGRAVIAAGRKIYTLASMSVGVLSTQADRKAKLEQINTEVFLKAPENPENIRDMALVNDNYLLAVGANKIYVSDLNNADYSLKELVTMNGSVYKKIVTGLNSTAIVFDDKIILFENGITKEISTTSALATTTSDEEASFVGGVVYKNITNPNITDFIDAAVNHDGSWLFLVKTDRIVVLKHKTYQLSKYFIKDAK